MEKRVIKKQNSKHCCLPYLKCKDNRVITLFLFTLIAYIFLISTLVIVPVSADFYTNHNFKSISLELNMTDSYSVSNYDNGFIKTLNINSYLVPQNNEFQKLNFIEPYPIINGKFVNASMFNNNSNYIKYVFYRPSEGKHYFGYFAKVITTFKPMKINKVISYPYVFNNDSLKKYLEPTKMINSNDPSIEALAKQIRANSSDYFEVVFNTAKWVKNHVNYDLTTLTADVTKNATWVLKNRRGVCDEITVLFIALLRANGIPAKFISGLAYTTSPLFNSNWGFHGWAEVYFPEFGWLPFDVTFGEYGDVDPLRIILSDSNTAVKPAITYYSKQYHSNVNLGQFKPTVKIINYTLLNSSEYLKINSNISYKSINFGSYDLLMVNISNPTNYYKIAHFSVSSSKEVSLDNKSYVFYLLPHGHAEYISLIHLKHNLNKKYKYSIPIIIELNGKTLNKLILIVTGDSRFYQKSFFSNYFNRIGLRIYNYNNYKKIKSKKLPFRINCVYNHTLIVGKKQFFKCKFNIINKSKMNLLRSVNVCFNNQCQKHDLTKESTLSFWKLVNHSGFQSDSISIPSYGYVGILKYEAYKKPTIFIYDLKYPKNVVFNKNYNIFFYFNLNHSNIVKFCNVDVYINKKILVNKNFSNLNQIYEVSIPFNNYFMDPGVNNLRINARCFDSFGSVYVKTINKKILMQKINFWQRILKFIYNLFS